jgi:hypothetical protein
MKHFVVFQYFTSDTVPTKSLGSLQVLNLMCVLLRFYVFRHQHFSLRDAKKKVEANEKKKSSTALNL